MARSNHEQELARYQQDVDLVKDDLEVTRSDLSESQLLNAENRNTIEGLNGDLEGMQKLQEKTEKEVREIENNWKRQ